MPKETDRLKLPLPLGNESVTRESINGIFEKIDAGVATREDLDTLREAVSEDRLAAQKYVDDRPWQKYKLTEDNGLAKFPEFDSDLDDLTVPGVYYANFVTGLPGTGAFYVEVIAGGPAYLMQRATQESTRHIYVRVKVNNTWSAWTLQVQKENLWGAF